MSLSDSEWQVTSITINWVRGRDHQIVNQHRKGFIEITLSTGSANSTHLLYYGLAAGDVIEHTVANRENPPSKKVSWVDKVKEGSVIQSTEDIPDEWKQLITEELNWLVFSVVSESPEWHYP